MKSKKTYTDKKIFLYQLIQLVEAIYPNAKTMNPYFEMFQEQLQTLELEEQLLYHKLLHCYTLLNKQTRLYENGHTVMSSQEDMINIFYFFRKDHHVATHQLYNFYDDLEKTFKKTSFTKLDIQVKLRTNETFVERALKQLQSLKMVQCIQFKAGQKNQYQLLEKPKLLQNKRIQENQDIYKEAFEEWEDFRGFEQF